MSLFLCFFVSSRVFISIFHMVKFHPGSTPFFGRLQDAERAEELHRCREKVEFLEEELRKTRALDFL